jgi:energy-coupling factor transport system ATP-binding protein
MADSISIKSFTFRYPGSHRNALTEVSLEIQAGSCCAILGPTGAGKSTLLQAMAGVLGAHHAQAAADGHIQIGSVAHSPLPRSILFPQVGLFLQDPTVQISGIRDNVEDEVRFTLDNLQVGDEEAVQRVRIQLEELGLGKLATRPLRQLSGGELQRVALAGMLVASPPVLLLDEPLNSLDATAQARLLRLFATFRGRHTVVLTDYGIDAALRLADRVVVLSEGRVLYQGAPSGLVSRSEEFVDLLPADSLVRLSGLAGDERIPSPERRFFRKILGAL